jgi:hypothetical protein
MRDRAWILALAIAVTARASGARAAEPAAAPALPIATYEDRSKSMVGAVVLEIALPGAGSLYAHDPQGALLTWGLSAAGLAAFFVGLSQLHLYAPDGPPPPPMAPKTSPLALPLILGGAALGIYARVHGIQSAAAAADRYNAALRASLALAPFVTSDARGIALAGHF